ncbi:nucleotidyltransferase domain-containing protein [Bacterioplanoides sp.]|uniref:nucleotidyltransferase domain-containing protein n=1 Tax=Bacterioplanoides sp. TaxID=2066072 RepID=UPI003B5C4739
MEHQEAVPLNKVIALQWIVALLEQHHIPYLICGGLAANFYGSQRELNDIDLFVAEEYFQQIVRLTSEYISRPPERYLEQSEGWDLDYFQLIYHNTKIEIGSHKDVRIFDANTQRWTSLNINFETKVRGQVAGVTADFMAQADLIAYKDCLARTVDCQDVRAISGS